MNIHVTYAVQNFIFDVKIHVSIFLMKPGGSMWNDCIDQHPNLVLLFVRWGRCCWSIRQTEKNEVNTVGPFKQILNGYWVLKSLQATTAIVFAPFVICNATCVTADELWTKLWKCLQTFSSGLRMTAQDYDNNVSYNDDFDCLLDSAS